MTTTITVDATLQPDGLTLHLEKKLALPPGRVVVTVQAAGASSGRTMQEILDQVHQNQQQRGARAMSEETQAAEIAQMRAEDEDYEQRWRAIWAKTGVPT